MPTRPSRTLRNRGDGLSPLWRRAKLDEFLGYIFVVAVEWRNGGVAFVKVAKLAKKGGKRARNP
jgi:hypothetical protein